MSDLVERYVQEVGRYLPVSRRAAIMDDLRSQIHDQLDDRYDRSPTPAQVVETLAGIGEPYLMAREYAGDHALIGPLVYPFAMRVLRYVWVIVPAIAIFLSALSALNTSGRSLPEAIFDALWGAVQAALNVSALVVVVFAVLERAWNNSGTRPEAFDPHKLPEINDPRAVDRVEAVIGIIISAVLAVVILGWARAGGLILGMPGEIIPAPVWALLLLAALVLAMLVMNAWVLGRGRWGALSMAGQTALEVVALFSLYFGIWQPLFTHWLAGDPGLAGNPLIANGALLLTAFGGVSALFRGGRRLVRLLE
jgi:hypothetical protein